MMTRVKEYLVKNRRRIWMSLLGVIAGCGLFLLAGHAIGEIPTIAGVGTIVTAFFMGPLIELFNEKIARPMLKAGTEPASHVCVFLDNG